MACTTPATAAARAGSSMPRGPNKDLTLEFVKYMFSPEVYRRPYRRPRRLSRPDERPRPGQESQSPGDGDLDGHGRCRPHPVRRRSWDAVVECLARAFSTARSSRRPRPGRSSPTWPRHGPRPNRPATPDRPRTPEPCRRIWSHAMTQTFTPAIGSPGAFRRNWPIIAFLSPAAIVLLLFMAVPMVNSIILSFQSWNGMSPPVWAGLKNYRALFGDRLFLDRARQHRLFHDRDRRPAEHDPAPRGQHARLQNSRRHDLPHALLHARHHLAGDQRPALGDDLRAEFRHPERIPALYRPRQFHPTLAGRSQHRHAEHHLPVSVWQSLGFYLVIYYAAMQNIPRSCTKRPGSTMPMRCSGSGM